MRGPRSFGAMREDRVLDMASRRFGKSYTSKAAAVRDLSALPVAEQHALPKRADPSRKLRPAPYSNARVLDAMRGGIARAPDPLKLANAVYDKPHSVIRLARATTNIKVVSPTQGLAMLAKFGGTEMKRSANAAYSELAHQHGGRPPAWPKGAPMAAAYAPPPTPAPAAARPRRNTTPPQPKGPLKRDLLRQYERHTGLAASPRATNTWLASETAAARSRYNANRVSAQLQVAALVTAGVGAYRRERARQAAEGGTLGGDMVGKVRAGVEAATAVAPGVALTMLQGAANQASHKFISLPFGLAVGNPISGPMAMVTKAAGRSVMPVLAAWSMHREALADHESAWRGAGRGLVQALDVTGIFLDKGLGQRLYDRTLGTPKSLPEPTVWDRVTGQANDPKFSRQPNGYERFIDQTKRRLLGGKTAYLNSGAASVAQAAAPPARAQATAVPPSYKDIWTDSRGRTYERHDLSVRKAA